MDKTLTLITFVRYEVWCLIGALFLLIGYQILTGRIKTSGLLYAKTQEAGISPARIQLLVFTITGAFYYLLGVMENPSELPDVPQQLLLALGGSNVFFVASKGYSQLHWIRRETNATKSKKGGT